MIFYYFTGINPDIYYPIWYKITRVVWVLLGLSWLSLVVGAKADCINRLLEPDRTEKQEQHEMCDVCIFYISKLLCFFNLGRTTINEDVSSEPATWLVWQEEGACSSGCYIS